MRDGAHVCLSVHAAHANTRQAACMGMLYLYKADALKVHASRASTDRVGCGCILFERVSVCACACVTGISYGALSASWDPSRDGSTVGWTEFKTNVDILLNKDRQGNR